MALLVDFNKPMGEMTYVNEETHEEDIVEIYYSPNSLGAQCRFDKERREYDLFGFWGDMQHLKNLLGFSKKYGNHYRKKFNGWELNKVRLNLAFKDMEKVAKLFAKAGFRVEVYYLEEDTKNESQA